MLTGGDSGRAGIRTRRSRRSGPRSAGGGERARLLSPRGCPVGEQDALREQDVLLLGRPRLRKAGTRKLATELDTGSFCSREVLFQEGRRWAFCLQKWSTLATPERTREREIHAAFSEPRAAPAPFEDVTPGEAVT